MDFTQDPDFQEFEEALDGYERILSKRRYLASDHGVRPIPAFVLNPTLSSILMRCHPQQLTSVDLLHLPLAHFLATIGINIMYDTKRPNLVRYVVPVRFCTVFTQFPRTRWFNDLTSRPSWKANELVVTPFSGSNLAVKTPPTEGNSQ